MLLKKVTSYSTDWCLGLNNDQCIRHFLIGETAEGCFQIQGTEVEPKFRSLTDLVVYHCQYAGALPCVLRLPGYAPATSFNTMPADTYLPPNKYQENDSIGKSQLLPLSPYLVNRPKNVNLRIPSVFARRNIIGLLAKGVLTREQVL